VVRGLPRFDGRSSFTTWIYRVTTNACLDELRRRRRRPEPGLPDLERAPAMAGPDIASSIADALVIDAALGALPPDYRAAVVLRDLCGLDYAEIAEVLAIPPGTVRSRIARGRAAMARTIDDREPGLDPDRPKEST
jgi:RNA polymerase sigma-70 factor (ECF subfamily)